MRLTSEKEAEYAAIDVEPNNDWLLCDMIKEEPEKGKLIVPQGSSGTELAKLYVLRAGPGRTNPDGSFTPNPYQVGDVIYSTTEIPPDKVLINGRIMYMIRGCQVIFKAPKFAEAYRRQVGNPGGHYVGDE